MSDEKSLPRSARAYCRALQKRVDCKEWWGCDIGCPLFWYLSILARHLDAPTEIEWDTEVEFLMRRAITPDRAHEIIGDVLNERVGMTLEQVQEELKDEKNMDD